MKNIAVGIMSGTSADGISLVAARFAATRYDILAYDTFDYRAEISNQIISAPAMKAPEISRLNFLLGRVFADSADRFLKKHRISRSAICVIGSHGQTVYHGPDERVPSTLQIGEPSVIAGRTGVTVVSDFRTADVAVGGSGAPLIPFFDHWYFGQGPTRALQNVGGIANVTIVGKNAKRLPAFDNGPGNCLMDWAVRLVTRGRSAFDKSGNMARRGKVHLPIVQEMLKHSFFRKQPPKSTGRELFNEHFLPLSMRKLLRANPCDAIATLNYFTACAIADSYRRFVYPDCRPEEVIVSGGGAMNETLMNNLSELLSPISVCSIFRFGMHPQAKEPLAFAFYAWLAVRGKPNHLPITTGASRAVILGKITPGNNFKKAVLR